MEVFNLRRAVVVYIFLLLSDKTLSLAPNPLNPKFVVSFRSNHSTSTSLNNTSSLSPSSADADAGAGVAGPSSTQEPPLMDKAKSLISTAISIGVPAYNTGDIKECARVYKDTALTIAPMLPSNLQAELGSTLRETFRDANEEAWAFRRNFDSIMEYVVPFGPQDTDDASTSTFRLEPFTGSMIPLEPCVVNDNVMGGMSKGAWISSSKSFRGTTSLANNGGFSSLRWRFDRIQNWSYAKGIYLKVKHSNPTEHTFRVILKDTTCDRVRGANFKNVFGNPSQSIENPILIPFESFDQMEQMGRPLSGPVFDRSGVTELGVMAIKPTVVGDFELRIEEWGLYS